MALPSPQVVVIKKNGSDGPSYPLSAPIITIGSSSTSNIRIALTQVADLHAQLEIDERNNVWVHNIAKDDGVRIGSKSLQADTRHLLQNSEVFTIGGRSFRIELPQPEGKRYNLRKTSARLQQEPRDEIESTPSKKKAPLQETTIANLPLVAESVTPNKNEKTPVSTRRQSARLAAKSKDSTGENTNNTAVPSTHSPFVSAIHVPTATPTRSTRRKSTSSSSAIISTNSSTVSATSVHSSTPTTRRRSTRLTAIGEVPMSQFQPLPADLPGIAELDEIAASIHANRRKSLSRSSLTGSGMFGNNEENIVAQQAADTEEFYSISAEDGLLTPLNVKASSRRRSKMEMEFEQVIEEEGLLDLNASPSGRLDEMFDADMIQSSVSDPLSTVFEDSEEDDSVVPVSITRRSLRTPIRRKIEETAKMRATLRNPLPSTVALPSPVRNDIKRNRKSNVRTSADEEEEKSADDLPNSADDVVTEESKPEIPTNDIISNVVVLDAAESEIHDNKINSPTVGTSVEIEVVSTSPPPSESLPSSVLATPTKIFSPNTAEGKQGKETTPIKARRRSSRRSFVISQQPSLDEVVLPETSIVPLISQSPSKIPIPASPQPSISSGENVTSNLVPVQPQSSVMVMAENSTVGDSEHGITTRSRCKTLPSTITVEPNGKPARRSTRRSLPLAAAVKESTVEDMTEMELSNLTAISGHDDSKQNSFLDNQDLMVIQQESSSKSSNLKIMSSEMKGEILNKSSNLSSANKKKKPVKALNTPLRKSIQTGVFLKGKPSHAAEDATEILHDPYSVPPEQHQLFPSFVDATSPMKPKIDAMNGEDNFVDSTFNSNTKVVNTNSSPSNSSSLLANILLLRSDISYKKAARRMQKTTRTETSRGRTTKSTKSKFQRFQAKAEARKNLVNSLHNLLISPEKTVPNSIRELVEPIYATLTTFDGHDNPGTSISSAVPEKLLKPPHSERDSMISNIIALMSTPTQKLPVATRDNIDSIFESLSCTPLNSKLNFSEDEEVAENENGNKTSSTEEENMTPDDHHSETTTPAKSNTDKVSSTIKQGQTSTQILDGEDPLSLSVFEGLEEVLAWTAATNSPTTRKSLDGANNIDFEEQSEAWKDAVYAAIVNMMLTHEDEYSSNMLPKESENVCEDDEENEKNGKITAASKRKLNQSLRAQKKRRRNPGKHNNSDSNPNSHHAQTQVLTEIQTNTENEEKPVSLNNKKPKRRRMKPKMMNSKSSDSSTEPELRRLSRSQPIPDPIFIPSSSPVEVSGQTIPPTPPSPKGKRTRFSLKRTHEVIHEGNNNIASYQSFSQVAPIATTKSRKRRR